MIHWRRFSEPYNNSRWWRESQITNHPKIKATPHCPHFDTTQPLPVSTCQHHPIHRPLINNKYILRSSGLHHWSTPSTPTHRPNSTLPCPKKAQPQIWHRTQSPACFPSWQHPWLDSTNITNLSSCLKPHTHWHSPHTDTFSYLHNTHI